MRLKEVADGGEKRVEEWFGRDVVVGKKFLKENDLLEGVRWVLMECDE